jgi:hypothetical protein
MAASVQPRTRRKNRLPGILFSSVLFIGIITGVVIVAVQTKEKDRTPQSKNSGLIHPM